MLRDGQNPTTPVRSRPADEFLLGTSFDESGLKFDLVYNQRCNSFFWVLRDKLVPEELKPYGDGLAIDRRTAFVYYMDGTNRRMLLIGVRASNVMENNWYDGPFDQLPDNVIKRGDLDLQPYIEAVYPWTKGRIDEYGVFLNDREVRVAIAPYLEYAHQRDVRRLVTSVRGVMEADHLCALADAIRRQGEMQGLPAAP